MIALVAASVLLQAPDLTADVRLGGPVVCRVVAPLSKALESVAAAGNITLTASAPFDEEIIALRVEGPILRDVMVRISKSVRLDWRKTETGYELYQTAERRQAAESELASERIGRLRELRAQQLGKFKLPRPDFSELARRFAAEAAEPMPDPNQDMKAYLERGQVMERLRIEGDPSMWFAAGVIAVLSDAQLTELLDAGSITLVKDPNRLQHKLPEQAREDAKAWARHVGTFSDVNGSVRLRMVDGWQVKVSVSISADRTVAANEFWLDLEDAALPPNSREPKETALDKNLEIEGYLGMRYGMPNSRTPSERVQQRIADAIVFPERYEPLEVMAGTGLMEIAVETKNNLIAILSDDMISLGSQSDLPKNGRDLLAQFCDDVRAKYSETTGWLEVAPRELALSRAKHFPRKYFRQIANKVERGRLLPLADVARIVGECTDLQLEGRFFQDFITQAAARQEFTLLSTWGDTSALRFWNSLTRDELNALTAGGVRIGRLNPGAKKMLWRAASLGGTTLSGKSAFGGVFRNPQGNDPTKVFPNGFAADEVLESRTESTDCVLSHFRPWKYPIPVSLSVEQFAAYAEPNKADMADIRLGTSHELAVLIDKLGWSAAFRTDVYDFNKPSIYWSSAPDVIKTRYEEAKKNPKNNMGIIIR